MAKKGEYPEAAHFSGEHPEWWDPYSCQPYKMADAEKPRSGMGNLIEYSKITASALVGLPAIIYQYLALKKSPSQVPMKDFAGLSINADKPHRTATLEMVEELGVQELLLRVPSWEAADIEDYANYIERFKQQNVLVNILQSRDSVKDIDQWRNQVRTIIDGLQDVTQTFWIGNAINRTKWGCAHSGQYLELQEAVESLREDFPKMKLLGSSIIDFEPLLSWRTLWNCRKFHLDGTAALLYVNRRHSPYGKQYKIFDLENKLRLAKAMTKLSNRSDDKLWITETNWPLLETQPYTPNSGHPSRTCDEPTQAEYLKLYYQIARQTGWVEKVYWWQLINPGYGLVDSRNGLRKMPSYFAFKELLSDES
jgi:hypothetical protein